jgi:hypothetical protein
MQDAIDRVMNTYTMIANLNPEKERDLRQAVTAHLSKFPETDAMSLRSKDSVSPVKRRPNP